jgi:hypothetical protein
MEVKMFISIVWDDLKTMTYVGEDMAPEIFAILVTVIVILLGLVLWWFINHILLLWAKLSSWLKRKTKKATEQKAPIRSDDTSKEDSRQTVPQEKDYLKRGKKGQVYGQQTEIITTLQLTARIVELETRLAEMAGWEQRLDLIEEWKKQQLEKQDKSPQNRLDGDGLASNNKMGADSLNMHSNKSRAGHEGHEDVICRLYNAGVENRSQQYEFQNRFRATVIGTSNAMQRRRDNNITPEFQQMNEGEYLAVQPSDGGRTYYVVPKYDLTFQELSYGPGAMGVVFDCPEFNPQLHYRHVKVIKPAKFECLGQQWILRQRGKLELGRGES